MGYDFSITEYFKRCKSCGRSDLGESLELYTSYNHSWAFYQYLDKKQGLRWIYGKKGKQTISRLETMLECLENLDHWKRNFETDPDLGDGWNCKELGVGNAYWFAKKILQTATKLPKGIWNGD